MSNSSFLTETHGLFNLEHNVEIFQMKLICSSKKKIAYLDYDYEGKRDGNIGGEIIFKMLSWYRNIDRCSGDTINSYDVVMVSIPSSGQIADLYKLAMKNNWHKRRCMIIVGGFGVQNVNLMTDFVDYAIFGRVHDK